MGFNWQERFADVFAAGGFDVVIGNPPYVRQETLGAAFKTYAESIYHTYAGTADLYVYFMEKGYQLLRENGHMGYIVPNKWLRANYGQSLREFLKEKIERLVDFGDLPVFAEATTYPLILTLKKSVGTQSIVSADSVHVATVPQLPENNLPLESVLPPFYPVQRTALDKKGWSLANSSAQNLLDKIKANGIPLGEYVDGKIYYGIKTGLNEAFVIDNKQRKALIEQDPKSAELIKPFLAGRDVKRYEQPQSESYLIFTRQGTDIEAYPAIKAYLEQFKERLTPKPNNYLGEAWKGRAGGTYKWYEMQATIAYYQEFEKPKIVFPDISIINNFTLDDTNLYGDTTTFIIGSSSKYLLGILNSSLVLYFFSQISSQIRGGYLRWKNQYVSRIPIRRLNLEIPQEKAAHDSLVALVEKMLKLKAEYAQLENSLNDRRHEVRETIESTDKAIDTAVYALYNLTPEEIAIVES